MTEKNLLKYLRNNGIKNRTPKYLKYNFATSLVLIKCFLEDIPSSPIHTISFGIDLTFKLLKLLNSKTYFKYCFDNELY